MSACHLAWLAACCLMVCSVDAQPCDTGFTGPDGGPCSMCAAGKFKNATGSTSDGATSNVCSDCPAFSDSVVASNELIDCTCNTGSTGPHGSSCTQCVAGTYKTSTGSAVCTNCPVNTYSTGDGATSNICQLCPAFSNSVVASNELIDCTCNTGLTGPHGGVGAQCVAGTYKNTTGSTMCTNCPITGYDSFVGSISVDNCFTCEVGCYSPGPGNICLACPLGTYKDLIGISSCLSCPANSIAPLIGSVACMECENSFTAGDGREFCSCNSEYVDNRDQKTLVDGWIGQYYTWQGSFQESNINFKWWTPVVTNQLSTIYYPNQIFFPWPWTPHSGTLFQKKSQFGARWQGIIRIVQAGVYTFHLTSDDGSWLWVNEVFTVNHGGGHPMTTKSGSAQSSVGNHFIRVHYFQGGGGGGIYVYYTGPAIQGSVLLPAFTMSAGCVQCDKNTLVGCIKCVTEKVNSCFWCPAGSHKDKEDDSRCTLCPIGKYSATISSACSFCPGNATSLAGSKVITSCKCNPGYTGEDGGACAQCGVGTFKLGIGPAQCTTCPADSQSPAPGVVRDRCLCNAGFTGPDSGACAACAAGRFKSVSGSVACSFCPLGSGSLEIGATNISICICSPGFTGGGTCSQCLPGTYKEGFGPGNCSDCPSNSLSSGGSSTASLAATVNVTMGTREQMEAHAHNAQQANTIQVDL